MMMMIGEIIVPFRRTCTETGASEVLRPVLDLVSMCLDASISRSRITPITLESFNIEGIIDLQLP